ncbi:MAG: hypothetical protein M3O23_00970, partial [Actinomycetota bacterium]|nr:hypothetical protein [Actinomycetota bacterium]
MSREPEGSAWERKWRPRWPSATFGRAVLEHDFDKIADADVDAFVLHRDFPGWRFFVTFSPSGVPVGFKVITEREVKPTIAGMSDPPAHPPEAPPVTARFLRSLPLGEIQEEARRGVLRTAEQLRGLTRFPADWA